MKKINIFNLIVSLIIFVGDVGYMLYGNIILKSVLSAMFVILGAVNFVYVVKKHQQFNMFMLMMLIGLFFAMLGDIVLEIEFIIGALLFAVGHVFFLVSYITLKKYCIKDLIISLSIFIPCVFVILFVPIFDFGGIMMQMVCIFYALIISLMTGKAIANYTAEKNLLNLVIMIGSLLFILSDFMLLFSVFSEAGRWTTMLCLATYYPAQCFLAYSILKSTKKEDNTVTTSK